jgi:hypothetical protein
MPPARTRTVGRPKDGLPIPLDPRRRHHNTLLEQCGSDEVVGPGGVERPGSTRPYDQPQTRLRVGRASRRRRCASRSERIGRLSDRRQLLRRRGTAGVRACARKAGDSSQSARGMSDKPSRCRRCPYRLQSGRGGSVGACSSGSDRSRCREGLERRSLASVWVVELLLRGAGGRRRRPEGRVAARRGVDARSRCA